MPIYEYSCDRCHHEFEWLVTANEKAVCPQCQSEVLERRLSVPAVHSASRQLPVCDSPSHGGCGLPQCGMGGCQSF